MKHKFVTISGRRELPTVHIADMEMNVAVREKDCIAIEGKMYEVRHVLHTDKGIFANVAQIEQPTPFFERLMAMYLEGQ